jgi:hypothetical protein
MAHRKLNVVAVAVAGFLFGLLGAEASFGRLRTEPAKASAPVPLLFSLELRDAAGELLANPLLVGQEGKPVHLSLSQPPGGPRAPVQVRGGSDQPGLQMSLDLDPQPAGERAVCVGYRLSLDSGAQHEGRIGLPFGERRSVRLDGGERLQLHFTVARAGSPAFRELLRARARPLI